MPCEFLPSANPAAGGLPQPRPKNNKRPTLDDGEEDTRSRRPCHTLGSGATIDRDGIDEVFKRQTKG